MVRVHLVQMLIIDVGVGKVKAERKVMSTVHQIVHKLQLFTVIQFILFMKLWYN